MMNKEMTETVNLTKPEVDFSAPEKKTEGKREKRKVEHKPFLTLFDCLDEKSKAALLAFK